MEDWETSTKVLVFIIVLILLSMLLMTILKLTGVLDESWSWGETLLAGPICVGGLAVFFGFIGIFLWIVIAGIGEW